MHITVNQDPQWRSQRAGEENSKPGILSEDYILSEKDMERVYNFVSDLINQARQSKAA